MMKVGCRWFLFRYHDHYHWGVVKIIPSNDFSL